MLFDLATEVNGSWRVNGENKDDDVDNYLEAIMQLQTPTKICPYCNSYLKNIVFEDVAEDNDRWHNNRWHTLIFCQRCAYWEFKGSECGNACDPSQSVIATAISARFSDEIPAICNEELAQQLRRNDKLWHTINPRQMELLVADIFKYNYKNSEVMHVGGPGDKGIDVIFVDGEGEKWLIQVKRRENPKKAEAFSTLQSILGTLALEGERNGIIVSTSDSFSYQARKQNERALKQGYRIELIDKGKIDRMLGNILPYAPWKELFAHPDVNWLIGDLKDYFLRSKLYPNGQLNFLTELYKH
ncbi:restriction endonuclease [Hymenobacter sp. HSC-4F20]|uniref:restriction endonuclease n=1 Tax=Hymenobacter sp. HSC-4F20 TaxID=2864135 RepID=UPI001C738875|nr:restriction endonuclease [Hymenobacter sp. HSC-4F20]MBX0292850.1 restriction endonuclease [Hymenobacter sp. HSC-4F20]